MKRLLSIILLAAALAASPAAGQTIKSLGYNTTNGNIVAATNVTFTNSVGFATNARAATRTNLELGATWLTNTNVTNFRTAIGLGPTNDVTFSNITASGNIYAKGSTGGAATNSTLARGIQWTNLGGGGVAAIYGSYPGTPQIYLAVGATNALTDVATFRATGMTVNSNAVVGGTLGVSNAATFSTNVTVNGNISVGSLTTTTPSTWALDATQTAAATNGVLTLPSNANVIRLTNNNAISSVTNGVLGAFYYLVNQATNAVTISNVGGITIDGAQNLTLSPNESATLVATGATNASVANRGDLTDVALGGTLNTAPSQTNAASASSLMTRDLVGQEFANPRTKMQTTYWFGLEGLGLWQAVNSAVAVAAHRGPRFGPSLGFYASSRSAVSAAGAGLRLGSTAVTGSGAWAPVDGGAFTMQTQVVNYYAPPFANVAFGFFMGSGDNTNFWGSSNSVGLYCVQQPTNSWVSNAVVTQHSRIAVSNVVWIVSTAGTNDATGPTWTDLIGSLVTNGSAVYRNLGPHTSNNWVLATGGTNASQIVMTNTGKSNWIIPSQGEAVLKLRYGTNTSAPFTFFATVSDGSGESAEVSLATPTNNARLNPQYWLRHDSTNAALGNDAAGIRYFAIDATLTPLTSP